MFPSVKTSLGVQIQDLAPPGLVPDGITLSHSTIPSFIRLKEKWRQSILDMCYLSIKKMCAEQGVAQRQSACSACLKPQIPAPVWVWQGSRGANMRGVVSRGVNKVVCTLASHQ